jgi:ribosomal protein L12E/L44/L45/RPP1/RPP2
MKVIPPNSKSAFNIIFARAQTVLRQNFGMELYEMRQRGKGAGAVGPEGAETQTQTQTQAQKGKKKARPSRLDVIEEEEEEEDEEEEAEEQQATAIVKRETPTVVRITRADGQSLDPRRILSGQSCRPKSER